MFDLDLVRETHPTLADEIERLRDHVVRQFWLGDLGPGRAAELLGVEPHVLMTLRGCLVTPKAAEAPGNSTDCGRPNEEHRVLI